MNQAKRCSCSPHVLVVEDEPLVRMITVACLEDLGCTALEARSADEALGLMEENPAIRLLFTDIQMPGSLDGFELAKLVKRRWPNVNIVISSGRVLPRKADLPEGVRFIAKPYYHHDLVDIAHASGC
jgi:two-component system, response regulator PdtaR